MATSFYSNVTATVEEYLTRFIDFAIAGHHHWCTISSEHTIARGLTLRTVASAMDVNLTGVTPAVPRPFSFEECFAPRYPYFCPYVFLCTYQSRQHEFLGGPYSLLEPGV
jgi:hypothetical protein